MMTAELAHKSRQVQVQVLYTEIETGTGNRKKIQAVLEKKRIQPVGLSENRLPMVILKNPQVNHRIPIFPDIKWP